MDIYKYIYNILLYYTILYYIIIHTGAQSGRGWGVRGDRWGRIWAARVLLTRHWGTLGSHQGRSDFYRALGITTGTLRDPSGSTIRIFPRTEALILGLIFPDFRLHIFQTFSGLFFPYIAQPDFLDIFWDFPDIARPDFPDIFGSNFPDMDRDHPRPK